MTLVYVLLKVADAYMQNTQLKSRLYRRCFQIGCRKLWYRKRTEVHSNIQYNKHIPVTFEYAVYSVSQRTALYTIRYGTSHLSRARN